MGYGIRGRLLVICTALAAFAGVTFGQDAPIEITDALAMRQPARGGRVAIPNDPLIASLADGTFRAPDGPGGGWHAIKAGKDGFFQGRSLAGGYVYRTIDLPEPRNMLLEAAGDTTAWVNGVARAGDPYAYGYLRIPVALKKGENRLLFACGRGRLRVRLLPARAAVMIDTADPTLPDILTTDREPLLAAVVIENVTRRDIQGYQLLARPAGATEALAGSLPTIPAMTVRKVPFRIAPPSEPREGKLDVSLELRGPDGATVDTGSITLRVMNPLQVHRRTFLSGIDGSVQYYAINPAQKPADSNVLILTLHGASVEALGQAQAYKSKDDITLVAPTNRRPYGFDWEDIGRLDALEVLDIAERTIPHDPHRVILAGHSMGGHGTWHVGLMDPDRFAAIGPSAGWSSFNSYVNSRGATTRPARARPPMEEPFELAAAGSDTLSLVRNSLSEDVYILHGAQDDNVPVSEARLMHRALSFHPHLIYHEQPGAGHWWGSQCVDWPPMFAMFEKARLPSDGEVRHIEFRTPDPAQSARFHWATIEQQIEPMRISSITLDRDGDRITGTTGNVAMLRIDPSELKPAPASVELDGRTVNVTGRDPILLIRHGNDWTAVDRLNPAEKSAARGGPFDLAFNHDMIFVCGASDPAGRRMARLLAETFYYRGNGAVDIVSDADFDPVAARDRNVILFGNADTNRAWGALLEKCPIDVRNGSVKVGGRTFTGSDLAVLFLYPKPGSDTALVGAIGESGSGGAVTAERLPLLVSGLGFPDWCVIGADSLTRGFEGVRAAGYFDNDWSLGADR